MEAKSLGGSTGAVFVHSDTQLIGKDLKTPPGYKIPISTDKDLKREHTGAVLPLKDAPAGLVRPDSWFTLEVIIRGNRITTKVDGEVAVEVVDENMLWWNEGYIGLQAMAGIVQFRKIEIKELPPPPARP
jgi:hypothetical protein